jgi:hypothetical protein
VSLLFFFCSLVRSIKVVPAEIDKTLLLLCVIPRHLADISIGLDETRLRFTPDPKPWSASDILAHLQACSEVWTFSIAAIAWG